MRVIVQEVNTNPVRMKILTGPRPVVATALRPYFFQTGNPAGSVFLQIQDANGNKIKDSETIAISAISAAETYHGFYRFLINFGFAPGTEYYIEMKTTGYTYASDAFVGWCNSWEMKNSFPAGYAAPNSGYSAPLGLQIWSESEVTLGDN